MDIKPPTSSQPLTSLQPMLIANTGPHLRPLLFIVTFLWVRLFHLNPCTQTPTIGRTHTYKLSTQALAILLIEGHALEDHPQLSKLFQTIKASLAIAVSMLAELVQMICQMINCAVVPMLYQASWCMLCLYCKELVRPSKLLSRLSRPSSAM